MSPRTPFIDRGRGRRRQGSIIVVGRSYLGLTVVMGRHRRSRTQPEGRHTLRKTDIYQGSLETSGEDYQ